MLTAKLKAGLPKLQTFTCTELMQLIQINTFQLFYFLHDMRIALSAETRAVYRILQGTRLVNLGKRQ